MTSAFFGDSKLGYYVVVDLELYPGTSIPANKKLSMACDIQKERIKESFAELRGTVYRPTPLNQLYSQSPEMSAIESVEIKKQDKDKDKDKKTRGGTRKANKTRKTKKNKKSRKNQKSKKMKKMKKLDKKRRRKTRKNKK